MTTFRPWLAGALLAPLALLVACTGDDDPDPTPTSTIEETATTTSTPTPTATASPTATATPSPTATGVPEHPNAGIWVIDATSGELTVLYEGQEYPFTLGWADDDRSVWIRLPDGGEYVRLGLDGTELERTGDEPFPDWRCIEDASLGDEFEGHCGPATPDGQSVLIQLSGDASGVPESTYEAWVLNLESGDSTLVSDELRSCGGCDGRAAPSWSPSGRYLLVGETYSGNDSSVYLFDTADGSTRKVAEGPLVNEIGPPTWAPDEDAFLTLAADGSTLFERPTEGETMAFPDLPWPARFDRTGTLVYSPAALWLDPSRTDTVIADAASGEILDRVVGEPESYPFPQRAVTRTEGGVAAVLEDVEGCDGIMLYHPALDEPFCLPQAGGATFSPDGDTVAYALRIGGPSPFDGGRWPWDIVLLDVAGGDEQVLAVNAASQVPPLIRWNEAGTHLLVTWPGPQGI